MSALAVAPSNANFVLAGTAPAGTDTGGTIYRTSVGLTVNGATWASKKPRAGYVSSVAFDPWNANVAYATYSTFGGTHVWKSTDAGAHWSALDGTGTTIPDLPVHSIVVDPTNSSRLYVGTDLGVFVSTDGGQNWLAENTGFGQVVTEHLVINGANLYAFTHGRGVWRVPLTTAAQTALIELVSPSSSVTEGDPPSNVVHQVQVRIRTSDHAVLASTATVGWATADGTAKAGPDYVASTGTLTFPAGSTSDGDIQTIDLTIVSDLIGEPTQAFTLNLSNPTGAILARRAHTVTILDTPTDPPGVSINDISVTEGNAGTDERHLHPDPERSREAGDHGDLPDGQRHGRGRHGLSGGGPDRGRDPRGRHVEDHQHPRHQQHRGPDLPDVPGQPDRGVGSAPDQSTTARVRPRSSTTTSRGRSSFRPPPTR